MTEYKIGDRITYKGNEGIVIGQKGRLYKVRLGGQGYYHYLCANQMKPVKATLVEGSVEEI